MLEKGMFLNVSFTMLFEEKGKKKLMSLPMIILNRVMCVH